jgi:hypothetical protein
MYYLYVHERQETLCVKEGRKEEREGGTHKFRVLTNNSPGGN